jgi:hypothetical protein
MIAHDTTNDVQSNRIKYSKDHGWNLATDDKVPVQNNESDAKSSLARPILRKASTRIRVSTREGKLTSVDRLGDKQLHVDAKAPRFHHVHYSLRAATHSTVTHNMQTEDN